MKFPVKDVAETVRGGNVALSCVVCLVCMHALQTIPTGDTDLREPTSQESYIGYIRKQTASNHLEPLWNSIPVLDLQALPKRGRAMMEQPCPQGPKAMWHLSQGWWVLLLYRAQLFCFVYQTKMGGLVSGIE
jgi:hypothetical protein